VGEGPFPTETSGRWGEYLRDRGQEYGATTGRPRRCGWLDAVQLAYACRLNGVKRLVLTKPDVLDGLEKIQVCDGYLFQDKPLDSFPLESRVLESVTPRYRSIKGWKTSLADRTSWEELPAEFQAYVDLVEDLLGVTVALISTGVGRNDIIFRESELSGLIDLDRIPRGNSIGTK